MFVISLNDNGVSTRFVIGCMDQAVAVQDKMAAHGLDDTCLSPCDDVPERDAAEIQRAQDYMRKLFTH